MDKTQRRLMMVVPLIFITVIARFPAGLVLYWVTTNLWTVGQGVVTRRLVPKTAPRRCHRLRPRTSRPRTAAAGNGAKKETPPPKPAPAATPRPAAAAAGQAQKGGAAAVSQELTAEATGETVGEAKWNALRELERRAPPLDKAAVRFQVLAEGERGLLGVGFTPARVLAAVSS